MWNQGQSACEEQFGEGLPGASGTNTLGEVGLNVQDLHYQTEQFSPGGIWKPSSLGREGPALSLASHVLLCGWVWTVWLTHVFLCFACFLPNTLF